MPTDIQFYIKPGFATPVAETSLPEPASINAALRDACFERLSKGAVHANQAPTLNHIPGVFESQADLFTWKEECAVSLREFCTAAMYRLVGELNGYSRDDLSQFHMRAAACFRVLDPGASLGLQNHPMWGWSGIYCVDSGYPDGARVESGQIQWPNPNAVAGMYVDTSVARLRAPWSLAPKQRALEPGDLVIFPAWMQHQFLPFTGATSQLTVAFTAGFQPAQSPAAK